ncbi:MAG: sigma-54-dependent transcriptional regulator [Planctomycetota bacterium]
MIETTGSLLLLAVAAQELSSLASILRRAGYRVSRVSSGEEAVERLEREPFELIIADLHLPGNDGLELTRLVVRRWPRVPLLTLGGEGDTAAAVESMRAGAADFMVGPIDAGELLARVSRRLPERTLRGERERLSVQIEEEGRCGEILDRSREMVRIFGVIERIAETPSHVLIQGEPGTGKELIARAIHTRSVELRGMAGFHPGAGGARGSPREGRHPYVAVNCGAFSRTLLESQLFGHKKGTFTGAIRDQEGLFVAARSGTLFLDEITELDLDLQVKLLRALQEREVTPLGSTAPVQVHARIITATNRPIEELVRQGRFRADLYYRINVVSITVPPLRERTEDIPLFVRHFLKTTAESYGAAPRGISEEVLERFRSYEWPGNVRELRNTIERAFALGQEESMIVPQDLPPEILGGGLAGEDSGGRDERSSSPFPSFDQVVRAHLEKALRLSGGVKSRAAALLGVERNRLYRLLRRYHVPAGSPGLRRKR